jgi:uracil-DNA glycosylase
LSENPRQELLELTVNLETWLRFQRRLGGQGRAPPGAAFRPVLQAVSRKRPSLAAIREELGDCRRCKLARGRTHIVFGEGAPQARLMFVGEGPGREEDLQGRPFVGPAGQLLGKLLAKLGLRREEVYIANIVKCRPPGNRDPEGDEIAACLPFLLRQIESIQPLVIVTLGRPATQNLLKTDAPISKIRGNWQKYKNIKVMPTFHPSYLQRVPRERIKTWEDMQRVMEYLAAQEGD